MQIPIFNINENLYIGYSNILPENNYRLDVNGDINLTGSLRQNNILFSSYSDSDVKLLLNNGINSNIETSGNIIGDGSQLTNINANNISTGVIFKNIGYTNGFDLIFKFVNNKFIVSMIPTIGTFSINIKEY